MALYRHDFDCKNKKLIVEQKLFWWKQTLTIEDAVINRNILRRLIIRSDFQSYAITTIYCLRWNRSRPGAPCCSCFWSSFYLSRCNWGQSSSRWRRYYSHHGDRWATSCHDRSQRQRGAVELISLNIWDPCPIGFVNNLVLYGTVLPQGCFLTKGTSCITVYVFLMLQLLCNFV